MDKYKLEIYNTLNKIKPKYNKTKFPYNYWTPEKITETHKSIKIHLSSDKKFFKSDKPKLKSYNKKKYGGSIFFSNKILII